MTVNLPEDVAKMLNDPNAVKIISTVNPDGVPHSIRVGSLMAPAKNLMSVGVVLMKVTGANLEAAQKAKKQIAILVNSELKAYLITANVKELQKSGPLFDGTNEALKKVGLGASGVWTFEPTGVWNQSANYDAGKKIA